MTTNVISNRGLARNALASWMATGVIPNLNQVLTAFPKRITYQEFATPGQINRAIAVIHFSSQAEKRVAWGGSYQGWKRIDYATEFQIFLQSAEKKGEDAMVAFDQIVDAVLTRLRAGNHILGTTDGTVWQVAEGDIHASFGEPWLNGNGFIEIWASIQFTTTQMINA